jgi:mannose-1-phosphate guanylyltransferase/mannose-6-phosphate isomerase
LLTQPKHPSNAQAYRQRSSNPDPHVRGVSQARLHRRVARPWGTYDSIDAGDRFLVKRIAVNPGSALALQMHHHRAEHWIVVKSTAKVTRGDEVFLLTEN